MIVTDDASHDLVALNEALESLAAMQVSGDTVRRDWRLATVWLLRELRAGGRHDT